MKICQQTSCGENVDSGMILATSRWCCDATLACQLKNYSAKSALLTCITATKKIKTAYHLILNIVHNK